MDSNYKFPPGPRGSFLNTVASFRDPYKLHRTLVERYGDPVTLNTWYDRVVLTGSPQGAREMFTGRSEHFAPAIGENLRDFVPPNSMQLLEGERHRRDRMIITPLLARARIRRYGPQIAAIALQHFTQASEGVEVNGRKVMTEVTLEVILRVVFGAETEEEIATLRSSVLEFVGSIKPSIVALSCLRKEFFGTGPWHQYVNARRQLHQTIADAMSLRRKAGVQGDDLMSLLLDTGHGAGATMTDDEVRDELITMLFAGHETSASVLAWCVHWIGLNPKLRAGLEMELLESPERDFFKAVEGLRLMESFCLEAMRLNPIAPEITRKTKTDQEFLGYFLPAGTVLMASPYLSHYDENNYPRASEFDATRFLNARPDPFKFLAFGAGSHRCIGAGFSLFEMKVVLATLFLNFEIIGLEEQELKAVRYHHTLGPEGGVRFSLRRRSQPLARKVDSNEFSTPASL